MKQVKRVQDLSSNQRVVFALLVSTAASLVLFGVRYIHYNDPEYWYLGWNLFLAWLPLFFAWQLYKWLKKDQWLAWQGIALTILWLTFLPNSFYISSDLIHLYTTGGNLLYDLVMLLLFSVNGFLIGYTSLYIVHRQLLKKIEPKRAHSLIGLVLLLCSFAIYLGRYLRWNTWDVVVNPAGILFDVSDRIINPSAHPQTFVTTITFFVLLGSIYFVIWQIAAALKNKKSDL